MENTTSPQILSGVVSLIDNIYKHLLILLQNPLIVALLKIVIILIVALIITRIVSLVVSRLEYRGIIAKPVGMKIRSITDTVTYIIAIIAIAYTLTGVETLLIPLFIILAAILFSMWEFFANIIGYYTILAGRLIIQDAYIKIDGYEGKVKDITPMSIILELPDGSIVRVPNRRVFISPIKTPSRKVSVKLNVRVSGIPLGHTIKIAEELKEAIRTKTKRGSVPGMNVDVIVVKVEGNTTNYEVRINVPRNLYNSIKDDLLNESTMIILSELEEYDVAVEFKGVED